MQQTEGNGIIERLSGDYIRGYTKAIKDIIDVFNGIEYDLTLHHKRLNMKMAREILECCLENREKLRESYTGFVRWNGERFEWHEPPPMKGTAHWRKTV